MAEASPSNKGKPGTPEYTALFEKPIYERELSMPGFRSLECPLTVMADSYKAAHPTMYPPATYMTAYGEYREPIKGMADNRIVVYGIRHYIEQFISREILDTDISNSALFYSTHLAPFYKAYPYPEAIFDGMKKSKYFPVKIDVLPEGSVVYPHTPAFILTTTGANSHFCTFLETLLTMIWYPSTVATLSRHTKEIIQKYFNLSVPEAQHYLVNSKLHDFGFRGCTCVEQSVLGGAAHLLNFTGSDTMSACFHVQFHLNEGRPVGSSIPATEHSVMTSWPSEIQALRNLIKNNHNRIIACVMDSYDYENALDNILPQVKDEVERNKCILILRPDSGDPVKQVLLALKAGVKADFQREEVNVDGKNYIVFKTLGVIQGDGIDYKIVGDILERITAEGFSAQNVAFGMGGGLLQKVNRDTLSFATKLSHIRYKPGAVEGVPVTDVSEGGPESFAQEKDVMKDPITDATKRSFPGEILVLKKKFEDGSFGPHKVYTKEKGDKLIGNGTHENSMITVYDNGHVGISPKGKKECYKFENFDQVKERLDREWKDNYMGPTFDTVDLSMKIKQLMKSDEIKTHIATMKEAAVKKGKAVSIREGGTGSAFYQNMCSVNRILGNI
jgi:nicotinic acid phosphoribosyltransferase